MASLVHAYNSTKTESTGFSPYYLMFGREARLAIDVEFDTRPDGCRAIDHVKYVSKLRAGLKRAFQAAKEASQKSASTNKQRYDLKVRGRELHNGDRVLVRNVGLKGPHKLADRWKAEPYTVLGQNDPSLPVYNVQPEAGGRICTLHRNMLLPIGRTDVGLHEDERPLDHPPSNTAPKRSRRKGRHTHGGRHSPRRSTSDSESDGWVIPPYQPEPTYQDQIPLDPQPLDEIEILQDVIPDTFAGNLRPGAEEFTPTDQLKDDIANPATEPQLEDPIQPEGSQVVDDEFSEGDLNVNGEPSIDIEEQAPAEEVNSPTSQKALEKPNPPSSIQVSKEVESPPLFENPGDVDSPPSDRVPEEADPSTSSDASEMLDSPNQAANERDSTATDPAILHNPEDGTSSEGDVSETHDPSSPLRSVHTNLRKSARHSVAPERLSYYVPGEPFNLSVRAKPKRKGMFTDMRLRLLGY